MSPGQGIHQPSTALGLNLISAGRKENDMGCGHFVPPNLFPGVPQCERGYQILNITRQIAQPSGKGASRECDSMLSRVVARCGGRYVKLCIHTYLHSALAMCPFMAILPPSSSVPWPSTNPFLYYVYVLLASARLTRWPAGMNSG